MLARSGYQLMVTRLIWSKWTRLEKTGSIQYLGWSPNTSATFRPKPREKPLLSGPLVKTGALKASERRDTTSCQEEQGRFQYGAAVADRNL